MKALDGKAFTSVSEFNSAYQAELKSRRREFCGTMYGKLDHAGS